MRLALLVLCFVLGCGAGKQQTLTIVNRSPRPITEYYIYKVGSADHGASRGKIEPNGQVVVKLPIGNVEVLAVSDLVVLDAHTRDRYSASQAVELKRTPMQVIFHDSTDTPPGLDAPGVLGAPFHVKDAPRPPEGDAPLETEPTPEPPPTE